MLERLTAGYRFRFLTLASLVPGRSPADDPLECARRRARQSGVGLEQALLVSYTETRAAASAALAAEGGDLWAAWHARTVRAGGSLHEPACFACDASLGGLARWLRVAGYRARWQEGVRALGLVAQAIRGGEVLLTTDSAVLGFGEVRDGRLPTLWLPSGLTRLQQLGLTLADLELGLLRPRCMVCSGELVSVEKREVLARIPPRTALWKDEYFVCRDCARLYWQGTHWERIQARLRQVFSAPSAG